MKNGVAYHIAFEELRDDEVVALGAAFGGFEGAGKFDFETGRWLNRDG